MANKLCFHPKKLAIQVILLLLTVLWKWETFYVWNWISQKLPHGLLSYFTQAILKIRTNILFKNIAFPSVISEGPHRCNCFFQHFCRYLRIASMDFQAAYIIRKPFFFLFFVSVFVEVLAASFEILTLTFNSISCPILQNKISYFGFFRINFHILFWAVRTMLSRILAFAGEGGINVQSLFCKNSTGISVEQKMGIPFRQVIRCGEKRRECICIW